ncbi:MAG TPA: DNA polymerase I [Alphaproteobacteria bacterium]|nr:DNA polymerase I [Alphaproteobacteria bacterium]
MTSNDKDELYLIDGSGYIFRAYYAMAYRGGTSLTNPDGVPVGAVYGFTNMLLKLMKEHSHAAIAVIFDAARANFRNDIYADYKANRDETPEDLIPQFPLVREATEALGLPAVELEGYEADDLIATYAKDAAAKGMQVKIISSDKDLMQLVDDNIKIFDPMKEVIIDEAGVMEKFGVTPDKVIDVQSLAGDSSDNVPGVPGIGIKTAAQLINEYGSLEELLNRAEEIKQNKRRETIIENAEMARISYKLVSLATNAPVPVPLETFCKHDPDLPHLKSFLQRQGFKSLLARMGESVSNDDAEDAPVETPSETVDDQPAIKDNQYTLITDIKTLKTWIDDAYKTGHLAIDTETTHLTPAIAKLVGISICSTIGKAAYIPLGHVPEEVDLLGESKGDLVQIPFDEAIAALKPVLEDTSILKIGQNIKYDWQMLKKHGIHMAPCDDTMLISYTLDGTSHSNSMDGLSELFLDHKPIKYEDVAGKGKNMVTFDKVDVNKALDYAAEDADITHRLHHIFKPRIAREKMAVVYEDIERPLVPVIGQMELHGIKVDPLVLKEMSEDFGKRIIDLEKKIQKEAGTEFNVGSPKQIGEILFDQMGLDGGKKTKTGQWATDVSTLEKLSAQGHQIVTDILEWRGLSKLKSTYTDALQEQINPQTGRVHTSFSMAGTSTGRLASSDPNLQNIPIRTEDGRKIRRAFIAEKGHVLLSVDYSQVELRLAAEMAGVKALKQAFKDDVDIHALTASQVFGVPLAEVSGDLRRQAKAVNFGIIYGISGWGLAKQLDCDPADANQFIRKYLDTFHEIETFMDEQKKFARKHEYVQTLFGRKCYTPNINAKMQNVKMGAERAAINAPLQGTAADIMKMAMIKMPGALADANLKAKMLLQVHDELIFEVPEDELEKTSALVKSVMENVVKLDVPLIAEAGHGHSWAQAH